MTKLLGISASFWAATVPIEVVSLTDWCEENINLPSEDSAVQGAFRAWPFQREPMELISPLNPAEKVCLLCASQIMKTRLILNALAFIIAKKPGPVLVVEPTDTDCESLSKDRVDPMIRETKVLREKVVEAKSRDKGNTIGHKKFPGGHVTFSPATSPSRLAMRPIQYLFLDEVSRYVKSAGQEGDSVRISERRTVTFNHKRKIVYASSPGVEGACRISDVYQHSDQREWFVPCPHCNHKQVLKFSNLVWSSNGALVEHNLPGTLEAVETYIPPDDPQYRCENCCCLITEAHKPWMNNHGEWIAQNPQGNYPGFRLSQMVHPIYPWSKLVQEWIEINKTKNQEQLKVFVNTVLAETWKEKGEAPEWEKIKGRAGTHELKTVPDGVLFMTAFADVQKDRIEVAWWGWGRKAKSWLIDYQVIDGDTSAETVWDKLSDAVTKPYQRSNGLDMTPLKIGVDAGHETTMVTRWCRRMGLDRHYPVFGRASGHETFWRGEPQDLRVRKGKTVKRGLRPWFSNTSRLKSDFYGWLNADWATEEFGRVHIPVMADHWYRQLVSEELVTYIRKGYPHTEWKPIAGQERNEALDTRVGAQALAEHVGLTKFTESDWLAIERFWGVRTPTAKAAEYQVVEDDDDDQIEAPDTPLINKPPTPPQQPAPRPTPPQHTDRGRSGGSWLGRRPGGWLR